MVVGAGLSGLFTACELLAGGIDDVLVVEKSSEPGGVTRTIFRDGFSLEPGAGSFSLPHPDLSSLLDRIGAETVPVLPAASVRYVYTDDRLVALPSSPGALFAPILPLTAKLRALVEPLIRSPASEDESLMLFCQRRFGRTAGELLGWLMASGVFAGDPRRLSAGSAFPSLTALEVEGGSVIKGAIRRRRTRAGPRSGVHIPVGGMAGVATAAARFLGDRLRTGFEVESVREAAGGWVIDGTESLNADAVVVASGPREASGMLGGELGAHLARAVSAPVVVAGLGGSQDTSRIPPGYGVLVHAGESMISRGVLFESSYAPDRSPRGSWLVKVIAGGATHPGAVEWDERALVDRLVNELSQLIGADFEPTFVEVVRHRTGIPQYEIGHNRWLQEIDTLVSTRPGLFLTGWGYRGVGVAHIARDARAIAGKVVSGVSRSNASD
ncbi:MAG: protoporphyrinogen oxidase [Acidimicrobiia bacterium]